MKNLHITLKNFIFITYLQTVGKGSVSFAVCSLLQFVINLPNSSLSCLILLPRLIVTGDFVAAAGGEIEVFESLSTRSMGRRTSSDEMEGLEAISLRR